MRLVAFAFAMLTLSGPLFAQGASLQDVVVRQSVNPEAGAVIGQRVVLYVDVLFRGEMPRPPRVTLSDIPGLQAFRFETQGLTTRETLSGVDYVGQRFEFALYARRGGMFEISPAAVTLLGADGQVTGHEQGQAVHLEVTVPTGVDASQPVVATRRLTMSEEWSPDPKGTFKTGDAIVQTITRIAEDVPGLAMRDLAVPSPEGLRAYVDPAVIDDRSNRGVVSGRRADRITYVFEREGRFVLPAVTQPWWDLVDGTLKTADAAGVTIDVAASPTGTYDDSASRSFAIMGVGVVLLVLLAVGAGTLIRHRRAKGLDAEREAFAALRRACASADPRAAYRAFSLWRRLLGPLQRRAASESIMPLDAALFAGDASAWGVNESTELIARLGRVRRLHPKVSADAVLPQLNPG